MADDDLTKAARRARKMPEPMSDVMWWYFAAFKPDTDDGRQVQAERAAALLSMPFPGQAGMHIQWADDEPAPAVDRTALIEAIADLSNHNPFPEAEDIADGLIEAGWFRGVVTTGQRDGGEQDG